MKNPPAVLSRIRALLLSFIVPAIAIRLAGAVVIHPVPVKPVSNAPYTIASSFIVRAEEAANSANGFAVETHVHKVNYPPNGLQTNVYYSHFSFGGGPVRVKVTLTVSPTSVTLSPTHFGITPTISGNVVSFVLNDSRYLTLTVNNAAYPYKLIIMADSLEINPVSAPTSQGANGVYDVTQAPYSADNNYGASCELAFNNSMTAAHNYATAHPGTNGCVYVPPGVYKTTNKITAQSNVNLYLAPAAYIRAADNLPVMQKMYLIDSSGVSNFKIFGRGTIDCNGVAAGGGQVSKDAAFNNTTMTAAVEMKAASGFTIDGVVLRESLGWTVFPANSDGILIQNTKVVNWAGDFTNYRENDGLDLISCQNSSVLHSFVWTADDALCMKGGYDSSYTELIDNCNYRDVVVVTGADGAKYGFQGYTTMRNSSFKNIEIISGERPIAVHLEHGSAAMSNLSFSDITCETMKVTSTCRPIDFDLAASSASVVTNVTVTNFTSPFPSNGNNSYVRATAAGTSFNGVHFVNLVLGGALRTDATSADMTVQNVTGLDFAAATPDANLVLDLQPSGFSSNWNTLPSSFGVEQINDGDTSGTSEAQVSDTADAWVKFDFGHNVTLSKAKIFQDNGNYSAKTWKLERWDQVAQAWELVFDFTACPLNGYNQVDLPPVICTGVRITFHPDTAAGKRVGVNEVEVYGH
jgi:hypothetical protein